MVAAATLILVLALPAADKPVLIEFSASWCGPCQSMEPIVQRLASAGFSVRKVDVDQDPNSAAQYKITGLPSFVMLQGGREVDRVVGAASFARLQQMFERAQPKGSPSPGVRGQSTEQPISPIAHPVRTISSPQPGSQPNRGPAAPNRANGSTMKQALAATVRIRIDEQGGHAFGTGTLIDLHGNEALVVTCGHIFRQSGGKGPISVETFDGSAARPGQLVSYDLERDIGLVSFVPERPIRPAKVAAVGGGIRPGNSVFSIGCDRGAEPSVRESRITDVDRYDGPPNIEVAGQPVEGRSGGGLFAADGALIGICNFADPADDEGIYASLATIHWELDRIGQRRIYQNQLEAPRTQLAAATQPRAAPSQTAAVGTPKMPNQMPANLAITPTGLSGPAGSSPADLEVICIVRSRTNPHGESRVIVVDQPSAEFLSRLELASPQLPRGRELVPVGDRRPTEPRRRIGPVVRAQSTDR